MAERFISEPGFASTPDGMGLYVELASGALPIVEWPEQDVPLVRAMLIEDLVITHQMGRLNASRLADVRFKNYVLGVTFLQRQNQILLSLCPLLRKNFGEGE